MPGLWAAGERGDERGIPHRAAAERVPQPLWPRPTEAAEVRSAAVWCVQQTARRRGHI
jgi:hypothetical protein